MPIVNATCSTSTTGNSIIGPTSGILYQANINGRKTAMVRRYCAKLKSTVAIGRMARGNTTVLSRPLLSMIDAVDIMMELAKNVQASWPSIR